ncbi:MAG TPA: EAL domain-containing protein [Thermomicrobiales bacterium]
MLALDRFFVATPDDDARSAISATILESITDAVMVVDTHWRCCYLNTRAEALLGQPRGALVGADIWARLPGLTGTHFDAELRRAATSGEIVGFEAPFPPLALWFAVRAVPSPVGVVVYFRDITAQKAAERALQRQTRVFDQLAVAVITTDMAGRVTQWNRHATTLYGWTPEEALGQPIGALTVAPAERAKTATVWPHLRRGEAWMGEFVARHKSGATFPAHVANTPLRDERGRLVGIMGVSEDSTARLMAEADRRSEEARYRTLAEQIPAVVYVNPIGHSRVPRYISPRISELTGHTQQEWLDEADPATAAIHPDDRPEVAAAATRSATTGGPLAIEYRYRRKDGALIWIRDEAIVVHDADGQPICWQGHMSDVTERRAFQERLHHQATHDTLTGLPNRALFVERVGRALAHAQQTKGYCAVLFLDLDHFKDVNDTHGHDTGDRLLVAVAERLRATLRGSEILARLGGDEFTVLLERVLDVGDAVTVAERLTTVMAAPFQLAGREQRITVSIGIVLNQPGHARPEDLLRDADVALYRAKDTGRAGYTLFDPVMQAALTDRLALERDLWTALDKGEFALHYQPIVDLKTGDVVEVEALLRWPHPQRGWVSPADFIPIAESCGAIRPLGRWVLAEACRQGRVWLDDPGLHRPLTVAVNLCAREFGDAELVDTVAAALRESDFPPRLLRLEITETAAMGEAKTTLETMRRLRAIGVRLVLDDFGTGYSSLAYLRQFPVEVLKIDRAFIRELGIDRRNIEICRAIAMLAKTLRLELVAEGVETAEQVALVRSVLCDRAQGYYFGRPMPPDEITRLLRATAPPPLAPAHRPRSRHGAHRGGAGRE